MNFLESILFLILYVGFGAGIPLLWYATRTGRRGYSLKQEIPGVHNNL